MKDIKGKIYPSGSSDTDSIGYCFRFIHLPGIPGTAFCGVTNNRVEGMAGFGMVWACCDSIGFCVLL